jgi:hypothetical protein
MQQCHVRNPRACNKQYPIGPLYRGSEWRAILLAASRRKAVFRFSSWSDIRNEKRVESSSIHGGKSKGMQYTSSFLDCFFLILLTISSFFIIFHFIFFCEQAEFERPMHQQLAEIAEHRQRRLDCDASKGTGQYYGGRSF